MLTSITIRHVAEQTHTVRVRRAARRGQSLQGYLASAPDALASRSTFVEWLAQAQRVARKSLLENSEERVLHDLDADAR